MDEGYDNDERDRGNKAGMARSWKVSESVTGCRSVSNDEVAQRGGSGCGQRVG